MRVERDVVENVEVEVDVEEGVRRAQEGAQGTSPVFRRVSAPSQDRAATLAG